MAPDGQNEDVFRRLDQQRELYVRVLRDTTQELETKIQELGVLHQLGLLFRSTLRLEDLCAEALQMFLDWSDAENASIMLVAPGTDELTILAAKGRQDPRACYYGPSGHPEAPFRVGQGVAGHCAAEGTAVVADDVRAEPRFLVRTGRAAAGSLACLPLSIHGEALGVVNLSHPLPRALDSRKLPFWSTLASLLAVSISHGLLFQRLQENNRRLEDRVRERTRSLETANQELRLAQAEIARHNEALQQRVRERTVDLESALARLQEQHATLEEANRIKDEFLNNVNHELKTPLNAIIGYTGLILKDKGLKAQHRTDLELVEANGKHLQHILENILALKDIECGTVELERVATDVNELLHDAVASVRPRAADKGLEVVFEPLDVPPVWLDRTLVLRVVFNLLDNAIKFSGRGRVTVRSRVIHQEPGGADAARLGAGTSFAVVEVEDQGPGVRPEDVERIFQKFQQGEPPTKKHKGGSGVGLTIAKNLVELHRGRLWLASRPGTGSTFSFSLPLEPAAD